MERSTLNRENETLLVFILLSLLSLYILFPFLDAIILGATVAALLRYYHGTINRRIDNHVLSSLIVLGGILGFILSTVYFMVNNVVEIVSTLNQLAGTAREGITNLSALFGLSPGLEQSILEAVDTLSTELTNWLIGTFTGAPSLLINLGIFLFTAVYLYRDGGRIMSQIKDTINSLPETESQIAENVLEETDKIFKGVFITQVVVAIIVGFISAVGFYIISFVADPISFIGVWSILIAIAALLPLFAAFMIYMPLGVYHMAIGEPLTGSLIVIFGIIVINILTEVFLRPYVGSKRLNEHPLLIFIGFIAGPLTLGAKGIVIGPIVLILAKRFFFNYSELVS